MRTYAADKARIFETQISLNNYARNSSIYDRELWFSIHAISLLINSLLVFVI